MNTTVKALTSFDLDTLSELVHLEEEAFGEGAMNEWLLAPFIRHGRVFALCSDEGMLGHAVFMRNWDNPEEVYLVSISIRPDHRGKGLGARFLRQILERLERNDFARVILTVDPDNQPAMNMYFDRFDFEPVGFKRNEYGEGEHRIVMELDLTEALDRAEGMR